MRSKLLQKELEVLKQEREAKWKLIQTEAPEIAELLTETTKIFGKPEYFKYRGSIKIEKGEDLVRMTWDGKLRRARK